MHMGRICTKYAQKLHLSSISNPGPWSNATQQNLEVILILYNSDAGFKIT